MSTSSAGNTEAGPDPAQTVPQGAVAFEENPALAPPHSTEDAAPAPVRRRPVPSEDRPAERPPDSDRDRPPPAGAEAPAEVGVWPALLKTIRHFFPSLGSWLVSLADPRDPRFIVYPLAYVLGTGLMMFLTKLGARRQIRFQFRTARFIEKLNLLCGTACDEMLHPDTLAGVARRLPWEELAELRLAMIQALIRKRCLEGGRLLGRWYLVAVDMTGQLTFSERHCEHCLTQKQANKTLYYHPVLEAKLVTPDGFALSMATEFVENPTSDVEKQECERKAFQRLAQRLKRDFPQLRICLLLDGLYACGPVFDLCRQNDWRYLITFKEGSAPAVFADYESLKKAAGVAPHRHVAEDVTQTYEWVHGVAFSGHSVNVLECVETRPDKQPTRFVWATDLRIDEGNHVVLANRGGRVRWKIENQGFNIQKNNGYALEHAYSENEQAMKNFYLLLQIAHIIAQLLEKGLLAKELPRLGALKNVARLLLEELRRVHFDADWLTRHLQQRIQIRLCDSS
jgi:hypothetical protein